MPRADLYALAESYLRSVVPAKAGTQWRLSKRHWIPAWPFLETSPFGLVFAGMTM